MARRLYDNNLGACRLKEISPGVYRLQYRDPEDGHYVRRRLPTTSFDEALVMATKQNSALLEGGKFLPEPKEKINGGDKGLGVKPAMIQAIRSSRANARTKEAYLAAANVFIDWLEAAHPGLTRWRELRPMHIEQFVQHLEAGKKSHTTIRLYLFQIKWTSRFMAHNFADEGHRDIGAVVKLPKVQQVKTPVALDAESLDAFLRFLEKNDREIWPAVMLQALCGLRMREVLGLREQDLNPDLGTVTICETPIHRPKTAGSYRTLPIPRAVLAALSAHLESMRVRPVEGYLFLSKDAQPWTDNGFSHRVKRAMKACMKDKGPKTLDGFAPRRLRATFATLARTMGADELNLARYLGHTPQSVLQSHYLKTDLDDLRSIPALFDGDWVAAWREKKTRHCTSIALADSE